MKKHVKMQYIVLLFLIIVSNSCSNYLDLNPDNSLVDDEFWKTKEQVNSAVASIYTSMNSSAYIERVIMWGELRAEMMKPSTNASSTQIKMYYNNNLSSSAWSNWSYFYKTINYCNTVLEKSGDAQKEDPMFTETLLLQYQAEALTLRALNYFILVKNFKEVPLITTATIDDNTNFYVEKETENNVLKQIISDLTTAIPNLPTSYSTSDAYDKGRITKGAALAILSDVYLWCNRFDDCIKSCTSIENIVDSTTMLPKYQLVDGDNWFNDVFYTGNSSEGIFELQFYSKNSALSDFFYVDSHDFCPYEYIESEVFGEDLVDKRGNNATYSTYSNAFQTFKFAGKNSSSGAYRSSSQFYNNWPFYRFSEVLLMKAEAYLLSSDKQNLDSCYTLINEVHVRSGLSNLESSMLESDLETALLAERAKELAFEGKRWYDLLRFARRNNFSNQSLITNLVDLKSESDDLEEITSYYSDTSSYWLPIYDDEISVNPNLVQNPYYDE